MPVKIRLARHGRKRRPFYYIVAADSRAPRDGRYIERIGSFNPNTEPATIDLNFDRALVWLKNGAQPTDTCRTILSAEGVLLKKHLLRGVEKGAMTEAQANEKFEAWKASKDAEKETTKAKFVEKAKATAEAKFAKEVEVNKARAEAQAKKLADLQAAEAAENAEDAEEENAPEATDVTDENTEA